MADSYIQANTDGSGKKIRTYDRTVGANTVHEEVQHLAESQLATYSIFAAAVSIATVNDHVLQVMAGSSLHVRIRRIVVIQAGLVTTAASAAFSILRLTTAGTGGTSVTPGKYDTGDGAAGCTGMTLPSSKGTESTELTRRRLQLTQTAPTGGAPEVARFVWEQIPGMKPIIIAAGTSNGVAIKILSTVAAASVDVTVELVETAWL